MKNTIKWYPSELFKPAEGDEVFAILNDGRKVFAKYMACDWYLNGITVDVVAWTKINLYDASKESRFITAVFDALKEFYILNGKSVEDAHYRVKYQVDAELISLTTDEFIDFIRLIKTKDL